MQNPGFLLAKGWQLAWNIVADQYQDTSLTPQQIALLHCLFHTEGITQRDLAEAMVIDAATMTGLVTRLERLELIRRERDQTDRRLIKLYLAEQGRDLVATFKQRGVLVEARFQELLGTEGVEQLCQLLRAFLGWNQADDEPAPVMTFHGPAVANDSEAVTADLPAAE